MAQEPSNQDPEHLISEEEGVRSTGRSPGQAGGSENGPPASSSEDSPLPLHPRANGEPVGGASERTGGQVTNSPPDNVKEYNYQVIASGIDTLYLALDVNWRNADIFNYLEALKEQAKNEDKDIEGIFKSRDGSAEWKFNIKPHGIKGYSWILISNDYALKIGNWLKPQSRPSVMVEIRSEVLWRMGSRQAVDWIINMILGMSAGVVSVKPSRVDFCVDMIVPEEMWSEEILKYLVTRARDNSSHRTGPVFTGISIGKGGVVARIYDKHFEITRKSKKTWMFDVWKIDQPPPGKKIIRVEFQLRREVVKSLMLDKIGDLFEMEEHVWVYLTRWLKFQDRPGEHHTQRTTLEWWKNVQKGYKGSQDAHPVIRKEACRSDKRRLAQQMYGLMTSLKAADLESNSVDENHQVLIDDCIHTFISEIIEDGKNLEDLNKQIKRKRPKHHRSK